MTPVLIDFPAKTVYNICMKTINISLPTKLREQADELVKQGYYASISDLVRDALRTSISKNQYDILADQAKKDERLDKSIALKSKKDIENFIDTL